MREPLNLDASRESAFTESEPKGFIKQEPDVLATQVTSVSHVPESFAVVAVQSEGDPDDVSVPARDVEAVGAPALVGDRCFDLAGMRPVETMPLLARKHQAGDPHDPPDALAVVGHLAAGLPLSIDEPVRAPVAIGSPRPGHGENRP